MEESESSYPPIRRIVTGHDECGVAQVFIDAPAKNAKYPGGGVVSTLIWCTDAMPADIAIGQDFEDMGARSLGSPPPTNGTRFVVIDFPPGNKAVMHRTDSIDYVIVLSGQIEMDTDSSVVRLKCGDTLVQRGTNHAWVNRGTECARVAFVLIDANPLGIGHALSRTATAT